MKKTMENIQASVKELQLNCQAFTKEQREESFKTFQESTLKVLSKGFTLTTKESNLIASSYGMKDNFIATLKADKSQALKEEENDIIISVYGKVLQFASAQVSNELKQVDNVIYESYQWLKTDNFKAFNTHTIQLLGIPATKEFFTFLKAYMFTTDKELSKKAYVKKYISLLVALKEYQGNYSKKAEVFTFKHIFKDIIVSTFNKKNYTYEDLKAVVSLTEYKKDLVNDNMQVDTKVLNKALKGILLLNEEEEKVYYELFK